MGKNVLKTVFWVAAAACCAFGQVSLPPTIDVPVTYYDFRSDRSNPEFEQPHDGSITTYGQKGLRTGMVAATLDGDNKPTLGARPYRNQGIAHWFRDWSTYTGGKYGKGQNLAPVYNVTRGFQQWCSGSCDEWNGGSNANYINDANPGHDTSFMNQVISGKLTLRLIDEAAGMYEYQTTAFFPLDGRGFGNEWPAGLQRNNEGGSENRIPNHNFAFTMEFEFPFVVKQGMSFSFRGDDDVWVFVDKDLALDLGGIHEPCSASFVVTSILNGKFKVGDNATLRMFYVERHTSDANIKITTNVVAPPGAINISTVGNGGGGIVGSGGITKPADEKVKLYSVVYDDNDGVLNPGDYDCDHVTWTITGADGKSTTKKGCEIELADSIAGSVSIKIVYDNKKDPSLTGSANMNVNALAPAYIRIQLKDTTKTESDNVYFRPGEANATVYAVLYDKYGNKVGLANAKSQSGSGNWYSSGAAQWTSDDTEVATVSPGSGSTITVTKQPKGEGTESYLKVSYEVCGGTLSGCVTLRDSVGVGSRSVGAIAVGPPFVPGVDVALEPFRQKDPANAGKIENFYRDVINNSPSGGKGVLIAVDAPKPLDPSTGGPPGVKPYGKVMIYDAVGNLVRSDVLIQANGAARSYGYVWDGRNQNKRFVGPGTYLVRVTGRDADKNSFFVQKKVGVTTAK